jgi:pimeloyl-ACP methyl ester carboxylesterase
MPYADNGSVRIHYQLEGEGPALVLQHGFTESLMDWYECGYVEALRRDYRLILIDARGHGASDKPHDPDAYELNRRVADVVAVLDALDIAKALFWGYSIGGWIGFGIAKYAEQRVRALVIGGQHPYARSMEPLRQMVRRGIAQGSGAFVAGMEEVFGPESAARKDRLISADLEALLALAEDRPDLEAILPTMLMPCSLYAGELDPIYPEVEECSRHIPRVSFFSLPGLSHCEAYARSELVLPHVARFLKGGEYIARKKRTDE